MRNKADELLNPNDPPHPKDIAEETLRSLIEFSHLLENLCQTSAAALPGPDFPAAFTRLVDGLTTFAEGITDIKRALKIGLLQPVNILEADLVSILQDICISQEKGQEDYMVELLEKHLPLNLKQWRETGIPSLIRARDS